MALSPISADARRANHLRIFQVAPRLRRSSVSRNHLRRKTEFARRINPVGAPARNPQKFLLPVFRKMWLSTRIPPPPEGRIAIVTDVGSGMRWTRAASPDECCCRGRSRRVVLISRRWDQACKRSCERRWLKSPVHRGERADRPLTPIAQGRPDCFGGPVVTNACAFYTARAAMGAQNTRPSPRPLISEGHARCRTRVRWCREDVKACPCLIWKSEYLRTRHGRDKPGHDDGVKNCETFPPTPHTFSNACARSSMMSSACSRPVEKRMKPSPMPSSARASGFRR